MTDEEKIIKMKQNLEMKNEFFILDVIKHLETQIDKMKCCGNCKHGLYSGQGCFIGFKCENKNQWELAE